MCVSKRKVELLLEGLRTAFWHCFQISCIHLIRWCEPESVTQTVHTLVSISKHLSCLVAVTFLVTVTLQGHSLQRTARYALLSWSVQLSQAAKMSALWFFAPRIYICVTKPMQTLVQWDLHGWSSVTQSSRCCDCLMQHCCYHSTSAPLFLYHCKWLSQPLHRNDNLLLLPVGARQRQPAASSRLVTCPHIQHAIIHRYSYCSTIRRKRLTPGVCMSCGSVFWITVVANREVVRIGFFTAKQ